MKGRIPARRDDISYEKIRDEILCAQKKGHSAIDFYGGEPLTYPFLIDLLCYARTRGLKSYLATNCIVFSSQQYTKDFFSYVRVCEIRTTLNDYRPQVHERVTQIPGSFEKTVEGIRNIIRYKQKTTRLSVNVVITSLNCRLLEGITRFIYSLGVTSMSFSGLVIEGRARENLWLAVAPDELSAALTAAVRACRRNRMDYRFIKMPHCVLPPDKDISARFVPERDTAHFIKTKMCRACCDNTRCIGVEKHIRKMFPDTPFPYSSDRIKKKNDV
jgi:MoaA/NifB/PqqE/SkfB family radical SAM enzyme